MAPPKEHPDESAIATEVRHVENEFPLRKPVGSSDPHGQKGEEVEQSSKPRGRQKLGRLWRLIAVKSRFMILRQRGELEGKLDEDETERPKK